MEHSTKLQPILESIVTLSDRAEIIEILQQLSQAKYQADWPTAKKKIDSLLPENLVKPLGTFLKTLSEDSYQAELSLAQAILLELPVASLTLPYIPTRTQLEQIHQKLCSKFETQLLVTAQDTSRQLFGITIDFSGKRYQRLLNT